MWNTVLRNHRYAALVNQVELETKIIGVPRDTH